jgi:4-carboxymuconolactone decarboxylase
MMVDLPSGPLTEIDPQFEQIALETGELTWGLPGISLREKSLLCLANDVCRQHLGVALRLHVQAALDNGVAFADLFALVRFVAPYAGYPASAEALASLAAAGTQFGADGNPAAVEAPGDAASGQPLERSYGHLTTDEWMAGFLTSRTTRAWGETRLSARERAYVALTVDVAQQTLGPSFSRHVELALGSGATAEQVRDAVRFTAEFGVVKATIAVDKLNELLQGVP